MMREMGVGPAASRAAPRTREACPSPAVGRATTPAGFRGLSLLEGPGAGPAVASRAARVAVVGASHGRGCASRVSGVYQNNQVKKTSWYRPQGSNITQPRTATVAPPRAPASRSGLPRAPSCERR
eukprot:6898114-Pyramimonas_sp.AAC.1